MQTLTPGDIHEVNKLGKLGFRAFGMPGFPQPCLFLTFDLCPELRTKLVVQRSSGVWALALSDCSGRGLGWQKSIKLEYTSL